MRRIATVFLWAALMAAAADVKQAPQPKPQPKQESPPAVKLEEATLLRLYIHEKEKQLKECRVAKAQYEYTLNQPDSIKDAQEREQIIANDLKKKGLDPNLYTFDPQTGNVLKRPNNVVDNTDGR